MYQSGQGSPAAFRHHVAIEGTQSTQGWLVPEFLESEKYFLSFSWIYKEKGTLVPYYQRPWGVWRFDCLCHFLILKFEKINESYLDKRLNVLKDVVNIVDRHTESLRDLKLGDIVVLFSAHIVTLPESIRKNDM